MLISFFIDFLKIFPDFLWMLAYFPGGSDPPDISPFFQMGVRSFFMGDQIVFDSPDGKPWPKAKN